jgi:hypothetical protein
MQPLKPEDRKAALENNPQASPEDLHEYERLLALRFTRDPLAEQAQPTATEAEVRDDVEERLKALHKKLFSTQNRSQGTGA